ncbi:MAG TPA: DUF6498-containing protein [Rudaea sp.]
MEFELKPSAFRIGGAAPPVDWAGSAQLFLGNAITVALALAQHWPMAMLIVPFWMQSVTIGWFYFKRILALQRFSTEGLLIDGETVRESPQTQSTAALFFAVHFGGFHLGYAVFLAIFAADGKLGRTYALNPGDFLSLCVLGGLFAWTQHREFIANVAIDRTRRPNIGALSFLPYLRVLPMHAVIVFGSLRAGGDHAIVIFGALKALADIGMRLLERRIAVGTQVC